MQPRFIKEMNFIEPVLRNAISKLDIETITAFLRTQVTWEGQTCTQFEKYKTYIDQNALDRLFDFFFKDKICVWLSALAIKQHPEQLNRYSYSLKASYFLLALRSDLSNTLEEMVENQCKFTVYIHHGEWNEISALIKASSLPKLTAKLLCNSSFTDEYYAQQPPLPDQEMESKQVPMSLLSSSDPNVDKRIDELPLTPRLKGLLRNSIYNQNSPPPAYAPSDEALIAPAPGINP